MNPATIVQKFWNYCNVLRDDGMSYGDYVELIAQEIVDDLEAALEQFRLIVGGLEVDAEAVLTFDARV
jgi:hypothetical protein